MMEESLQRKLRTPQSGRLVLHYCNRPCLAAYATGAAWRRDGAYRAADGNSAGSSPRSGGGVDAPRSLQELRELSDHLLSDHLLRDIGLTREEVGYEFPTPFSHCD